MANAILADPQFQRLIQQTEAQQKMQVRTLISLKDNKNTKISITYY